MKPGRGVLTRPPIFISCGGCPWVGLAKHWRPAKRLLAAHQAQARHKPL